MSTTSGMIPLREGRCFSMCEPDDLSLRDDKLMKPIVVHNGVSPTRFFLYLFPPQLFHDASFFVFEGAEFWPDSGREGGESPSVGTRRGLILFRFFPSSDFSPLFPFLPYLFPPKFSLMLVNP